MEEYIQNGQEINKKVKKRWCLLIVIIIVILIVGIIALIIRKIVSDSKLRAEDQKNMSKSDEELIGTHFYMPRANKEDVDLNLYMHEDDKYYPLIINVHGGAFIAGDADTLDTQSNRISNDFNVNVVSVNFKLAGEKYSIEYGSEEVADTVKYFINNKDELHIDINNIFLLGYSAGAYHIMNAALNLHKEGVKVNGQIICYGYLKDILDKYNALSDTLKSTMPKSLFILADDEPIGKGSLDYQKILAANGNQCEVKVYAGAIHGFIEENNPESEKLHFHDAKSPEQEKLAREAESYISNWINSKLKYIE